MKYQNVYLQFAIIRPSTVPDCLMTIAITCLKNNKRDLCQMGTRFITQICVVSRISVAISLSPNVILDADLARE